MRNRILFIIFLLLFSNPFSVSADVPIKVGIYQNKPKIFTDSGGNAKGFYIDILEYIASKEGWRIEYVPGTWDQCLQWLENRKIDLLPDIAFSDERAKRFDFNQKTVLSNWAVVFSGKDTGIESFADLIGKKIAFMKGDITLEQFKSQIRPFGIDFSVVESDDYQGVFKLLHERKVDAGLVNHLFGLRHEKQYNIVRTPIICCPRELRFAVPKNKNPHLIESIDRNLIALRKDKNSMYYRARTQWIEGVLPWEIPRWILNSLWFAVGLAVLSLLTIAVSRGQVKAKTAELSAINQKLRREITEHKQAAEALESERIFLSALLDNIEEAIVSCDEQGKLVRFNHAARNLHGLPEQPIPPDQWSEHYDLYKPDGYTPMPMEEIPLYRALQDRLVRNEEIVVTPKHGDSRVLAANGQALKDATGRIIGAVVAMHDITERKQVEESLRDSEKRIRNLFEQAADGIFLIAPDHRYLDANAEGLRMLGYSRDEILALRVHDVLAENERHRLDTEVPTMIEGTPHLAEWIHLRKDGTTFPAEVSARMLDGDQYLAIVRDLTARKQTEEELRIINEELLVINRIITTTTTTTGVQVVLESLLDEALKITELEGGRICLITPEDTLRLFAHRATSQAVIQDLTINNIKIGDCLCGECARNNKPLILPDREAILKVPTREAICGEDIRFFAAFPLIIKGRTTGVLCIFARSETKPSERSLKLVQGICGPTALAIENARLYDEVKQHAVTLEKRVDERTSELRRMVNLMAGRELRMAELKEEIRQLKMDR